MVFPTTRLSLKCDFIHGKNITFFSHSNYSVMLTAKDKQALLPIEHSVSPVQDGLKQQLWGFCLINLFAETFFQGKSSLWAIKVSCATVKFLSLTTCKAVNAWSAKQTTCTAGVFLSLTRVSELAHLYRRYSSACLMQRIYIPPIPLCTSPSSAFCFVNCFH